MAIGEVLTDPGVASRGVDFPRLTRFGIELSTLERSRGSAMPAPCSKASLADSKANRI
jgi:hypothetical protein